MSFWKVKKYRRETGECPLDEWFNSRLLTKDDRRSLESRIDQIEGIEGVDKIPGDWVVGYGDTGLHCIKKRGKQRKALRLLCKRDVDTQTLIVFAGDIKKDDIDPKVLNLAMKLADEFDEGKGSVEDFS